MSKLTVSLPMPPTVNNMYRNVPGKGRVLTQEARKWKDDAILLIRGSLQACNYPGSKGFGPWRALTVTAFFATAAKRDLSNVLKVVEDAVCKALGVDDRYTAEIHLYKAVCAKSIDPFVEVRVGEMQHGRLAQEGHDGLPIYACMMEG